MAAESRRSRARVTALRLAMVLAPILAVWVAFAGRVLVLARPVASPDVIVSLGSHEWERLPAAAAAAARHPDAMVLLTQPIAVTIYNCHDCARRQQRLVAAGVDPARIHTMQLLGEGTRAEADVCRQYARNVPIKQLLIVTSPFHARRALSVFRHTFAGTGVEIGVEPATAYSEARPAWWWTTPYGRWYVVYEWAAIAYYAGRYGVLPDFDVG
jgi:uncharacterized SAM-binding protein YcdF (DUF218 family)